MEHFYPEYRVVKFKIIDDYSDRSKYCAEDGVVLVVDSLAFLDPVSPLEFFSNKKG
jgi:hypothetical protein